MMNYWGERNKHKVSYKNDLEFVNSTIAVVVSKSMMEEPRMNQSILKTLNPIP